MRNTTSCAVFHLPAKHHSDFHTKYYIFKFFITRKVNCKFKYSKVVMNKDCLETLAALIKKG